MDINNLKRGGGGCFGKKLLVKKKMVRQSSKLQEYENLNFKFKRFVFKVSAEKTDSKNYTKWKPPKNKLTQVI